MTGNERAIGRMSLTSSVLLLNFVRNGVLHPENSRKVPEQMRITRVLPPRIAL